MSGGACGIPSGTATITCTWNTDSLGVRKSPIVAGRYGQAFYTTSVFDGKD